MEATEDNVAMFHLFKAMLMDFSKANISFAIKDGKIKSNYESETFRIEKDPINKLELNNEPLLQKKTTRVVERCIDTIMDQIAENNEVTSIKKGCIQVTHRSSKKYFILNIVYGYVEFGIGPFVYHYERFKYNEKIMNFIATAFTYPEMPMKYIESSLKKLDRFDFAEGVLIDQHLILSPTFLRIVVGGSVTRKKKAKYVDIPHDALFYQSVWQLCDVHLHRITEETIADESKNMVENIRDLENQLIETQKQYHEYQHVTKKRMRQETDNFIQRVKPKTI